MCIKAFSCMHCNRIDSSLLYLIIFMHSFGHIRNHKPKTLNYASRMCAFIAWNPRLNISTAYIVMLFALIRISMIDKWMACALIFFPILALKPAARGNEWESERDWHPKYFALVWCHYYYVDDVYSYFINQLYMDILYSLKMCIVKGLQVESCAKRKASAK